MSDEARDALLKAIGDPRAAAKLSLGCALSLATSNLVAKGAERAEIHGVVDSAAEHGVPEGKRLVWEFLLAYAAAELAALGVQVGDLHGAVEATLRQIESAHG